VFGFEGLGRVELTEARAGDIVAITGIPDIQIGETIANAEAAGALPVIAIEEPALKMTFRINDSPFAGREGQFVTSRQLRDRLYREVETNVALKVEDGESADQFNERPRRAPPRHPRQTMRRETTFAVTRPKSSSTMVRTARKNLRAPQ
jgi:GTP-binding protein